MKWSCIGDRLLAIILLLISTLTLSLSDALPRIDNVLYDTAQSFTDRDIPADIVLVTIDEHSLSELGRWPWSRRAHAKLIERLHSDGLFISKHQCERPVGTPSTR